MHAQQHHNTHYPTIAIQVIMLYLIKLYNKNTQRILVVFIFVKLEDDLGIYYVIYA